MNNRILISVVAACAFLSAHAATVVTSNGRLTYTENTPQSGEIRIDFAKCMANNLFTFSDVYLNGKNLNHTDSDNIGPFGLDGLGWSGGNHLNGDNVKSAFTEKITVSADGQPIDINKAQTIKCKVLSIEVDNALLMPASTTERFANEKIVYNVSGNSVEVNASHEFLNEKPATVHKYYGMQSMMIGETEMLTPGGAYNRWTPIDSVTEFTKASAPNFCMFIEHSPEGYQAAWMDPTVGLGNRDMVNDDDFIFLGHNWTKSYHKTIGNKPVMKGDKTRWHGIYTWYQHPLSDGAREDGDGHYSFVGSVKGQPIVFHSDNRGKTKLFPATPRKLRVMTYNLRFGERASMDRLAEEISSLQPDFVALQEVDVNAARNAAGENKGLNYINELAQRTGMFGYYGRAINFANGYYGVAILSRYPAYDVETVELPNPKNVEPRVMLKGKFLINGTEPVVFASTHLDFTDKKTTELQARYLLPILTEDNLPAILGGDFNATPAEKAIQFLAGNGASLSGVNPTFPANAPTVRLDHLFGFPKNAFELQSTSEGTISDDAASDHLPVISTITLNYIP